MDAEMFVEILMLTTENKIHSSDRFSQSTNGAENAEVGKLIILTLRTVLKSNK